MEEVEEVTDMHGRDLARCNPICKACLDGGVLGPYLQTIMDLRPPGIRRPRRAEAKKGERRGPLHSQGESESYCPLPSICYGFRT